MTRPQRHSLKIMNERVVSSSLLWKGEKKFLSLADQRKFCLGIVGWCPCVDCIDSEMATIDPNKPLSLKRKAASSDFTSSSKEPAAKKVDDRFLFDVTIEEIESFMEGECPKNTTKSNVWAVRNFEAWRDARNKRFPEDLCADKLFDDEKVACQWLCRYVSETRKSDGTEYTPRSLYLLLAGLQRHLRILYPDKEINLFSNPAFKPLRNTCDSIFKRLHSKGIGAEIKAVPVFTAENEARLWDTKVLSMDTPKGLLRAVFFYNGKNFCLRGGAEQRGLKISQFHREIVQVDGRNVCSYVYYEFGSKNRQGGFNSLNSDNKSVRQYENTSGAICHVKILDKYLQKIPDEAKSADNFYLTPLAVLPSDPAKPWFTKVPVGRNTLNKMLKDMCQDAGISETYTNHSLRAYGATTLFQGKVPEKIIQQRTGHKSLNALRQYERTTETQLLDISNVLSNNSELTAISVAQGDDALQQYDRTAETHLLDVSNGPSTNSKSKTTVSVAQSNISTNNSVMVQNKSLRKPIAATMILRGCNFTNCNIAFSGSVGSEDGSNDHIDDLFEGISVDQLYED